MQISATVSKILTYYLIQSYLLKKINLLHLRHLCFPGKFMNFLEAASGGVLRKNLLKVSQESCRSATLSKRGSNTGVFLSEHCEIFKNTYFEKHLLTAACDFLKQLYRRPVSSCLCIVQIIY